MLDIFISKINRMFQSDIFEGESEVPFPFSCEEKEKENWFLHIDLDIVPSYRGNRNQLPFYFPSPSSPPLKKRINIFPIFRFPSRSLAFPSPLPRSSDRLSTLTSEMLLYIWDCGCHGERGPGMEHVWFFTRGLVSSFPRASPRVCRRLSSVGWVC